MQNRDGLISAVADYMLEAASINQPYIINKFGITITEFEESFEIMEGRAETMYFKSHPELNP